MVSTRFGPILLFAAVGALVGYFIGAYEDKAIAGVVFGILVAIPFGLMWMTRKRRWIAVAFLNLAFAAAYFAGDIRTLGFSIIASILTFAVSAVSLRELYAGNSLDALSHHFSVVTGLVNGYQVIEDGQLSVPTGPGRVFGPRLVIIGADNAAIFARGSQKTKVLGPDVYTSGAYEYVNRVFDLRHARRHLSYGEVLTSDVMTVNIALNTVFGIDLPEDVRLGHRGPDRVTKKKLTVAEETIIRNLDLNVPEWEEAVQTIIESCLRQAVAVEKLDDLLKPAVYRRLETRILRAVDARVSAWGISIDEVVIESIQPSPEVTAAQVEMWQADAQATRTAISERARAAAMRDALRLMADGYSTAKGLGMSTNEIHREVLRRTLEEISQDPATKLIFTPELSDLLKSLGDGQN